MKRSRTLQATLGVLTIAPLAYAVLFAGYLLPRLDSVGRPGGISSHAYPGLLKLTFTLNVAMAIVTFILVVAYIAIILRSGRLSKAKKIVWTAILLVGNILTIPMFWYLYLWRKGLAVCVEDQPS